jgi:hypothetical protein
MEKAGENLAIGELSEYLKIPRSTSKSWRSREKFPSKRLDATGPCQRKRLTMG